MLITRHIGVAPRIHACHLELAILKKETVTITSWYVIRRESVNSSKISRYYLPDFTTRWSIDSDVLCVFNADCSIKVCSIRRDAYDKICICKYGCEKDGLNKENAVVILI